MDHQPPIEHHSSICVLSPAYQRLQELETLLRHPRLLEKLDHSPIKKIQRIDVGYLITNEEGKQITVLVRYYPVRHCGPAHFELEFPENY